MRRKGSTQHAGASADFSKVAARQEFADLVVGEQRRFGLRKGIRHGVSLYLLREQFARNFKRPQHRASRGEEAEQSSKGFVDKSGAVLVDELALESLESARCVQVKVSADVIQEPIGLGVDIVRDHTKLLFKLKPAQHQKQVAHVAVAGSAS